MDNWMFSVAGLFVGAMVGATGVGGGAVMTPLLILLMGVAPHTAVGTDLIYASLTKMVGVGVHNSERRVDWQVVRRLSLGSLPAAIATLILLHWAESGGIHNGVIIFALVVVLIITALTMVLKPILAKAGKYLRINDSTRFLKFQPALTVLAGAILGILVTLTSIGAGALGSVMLVFLYPLRLTPAKLVATDLTHAIPLALVAGVGHILMGNVNFVMLGWLLMGSVPGVMIGAHFGGKLPDKVLRVCIAVVLVSVGIKLLG